MSARLRGRVVSGSLFGCFRAAAVASRRRPLERDQDEDRAAHRGLHLAGRPGGFARRPARVVARRGGGGVRPGQRDGPRLADRRRSVRPSTRCSRRTPTLGYLAARTSRVELLAWVTAVVYREPGLLAKCVTTLDVLSGGRAWLGIGAAWNEEEARGLGLPFPPTAERFERLEEALQICRQMWAATTGRTEGKHYHAGAAR